VIVCEEQQFRTINQIKSTKFRTQHSKRSTITSTIAGIKKTIILGEGYQLKKLQ